MNQGLKAILQRLGKKIPHILQIGGILDRLHTKGIFSIGAILCCIGVSSLNAQTLLWDMESEPGTYLPILNFPDAELPPGVDSVAFHYNHDAYLLGFMIFKPSGAYLIESFDEEDIWFNWAKAQDYGTYEDGKVQFCSQLPWKATIACNIFNWDGKTFHFEETEFEDPSAETMDRAYELREAGKPCEAIEAYSEVEYPFSYFNPDNTFAELFLEAHELALKKYNEKDYIGAANEIKCILEGSWIAIPDDYMDEGNLNDLTLITYSNYVNIMGDYGLFLLRAKEYEASVEVNQSLIEFASEVVGPRLQLGDALYQLGRKEEAKTAYREFQTLMTDQGKKSKIPSRVRERQ